jgi:hypothetical protein
MGNVIGCVLYLSVGTALTALKTADAARSSDGRKFLHLPDISQKTSSPRPLQATGISVCHKTPHLQQVDFPINLRRRISP